MLLEQILDQITIYKKNRRFCSLAVKKKNIPRTNQQKRELFLNKSQKEAMTKGIILRCE